MKLRGQRPSEFSLQNTAVNTPDTEESIEEDEAPRGCQIEDAKTKFGTFFFGLLLMAAGTALLYFGFKPNPEETKAKSSSDNKILLTCGFVSTLLGLFCFVVSILMFKNVPCLYSDNVYPIEEDEENIAPRANSSFEVLPNSDEDDCSTISMYSCALQGSIFENMNSSFSLQSVAGEVEENQQANSRAVKSVVSSTSLTNLKSPKYQPNESPNISDVFRKYENSDLSSEEDNIDSVGRYELTSNNKDKIAIDVESNTESFEVIEETTEPVEKVENYFKKNFSDNQLNKKCDSTSSSSGHLIELVEDKQVKSSSYGISEPRIYVNKLSLAKNSENAVVQLYPERDNCPQKLCIIVKHGLKMYRWVRDNRHMQNFVARAKSSFHNFLNTFELEMNLMMGMTDPLKIVITAEMADAMTIEQSFCQSLSGQVIISGCPEMKDYAIPVLPIGYNSALRVAHSKIIKARQQYDLENNIVLVSTTDFIAEIYPGRWQMLSALCLEDQNLDLNLHNFTSTIPVPNEYIDEARKLTPEDYPFKEQGLTVTLEQAIRYTRKCNARDSQEILCGTNRFVILKTAADVLAGMYNKYVNRFTD